MKTRDLILTAAGLGLAGIQLAMLVKMVSVEEETKITREHIGVVTQDLQEVKKQVQKVEKKVSAIEKVVLYKVQQKLQVSAKDFNCLVKNIFHEAGVESREGKIAVAQVTLNRLKTKRWGNTLCDVVYAKAQFSWTLDKKKKWSKPKGKLWDESVAVANEFVNGKRIKGLEKSKFYHTDYIDQPYWAEDMTEVKRVGQHIFYNQDT